MFSCWLMIEMVRVPPVFTPVTAALISLPAFVLYSKNTAQWNASTDGCGVEKGIKFQIKEKMAVKVKHRGITRQERDRLLEISFSWQSSPALPSQRYLQERLLWLLFQQYPAMLFHGLPAWTGVGRACQHRDLGILSIVSCVWDFD